MSLAYLDGAFVSLESARISPLDRGFLFGDGAYEVIPVYSRQPFRLLEHLRRLGDTLAGIRLANPFDDEGWCAIVERLVASADFDDQSVYIQITRGADNKRDHAFPKDVPPTVFAMISPLVTPSPAQLATGVSAITAADIRWLRCDMKTTSLLANVLLRQLAVDVGCAECLLLRDGFLTEGAASNIFIVRDGLLIAPPKGHLILPGITYDIVFELAAAQGMPHAARPISKAELFSADEVWMTSSTREILPITAIDGCPIADGTPGPAAGKMHSWYQDFKNEVMRKGRS